MRILSIPKISARAQCNVTGPLFQGIAMPILQGRKLASIQVIR